MNKRMVKFKNPETNRTKTVVHFEHPDSDYSLCGCDLDGDEVFKYGHGEITDKQVNCRQCVSMVLFCKGVKQKEYFTNDNKLTDTHLRV